MARIIDIRSSENELIFLGGALVLPTSDNTVATPLAGSIRFNTSTGYIEFYNSGWNTLISSISLAPYDVYGTFIGQPTVSQTIWRIVFARTAIFASGLPGSSAICEVAPTSSVALPILKNGVSIGSIDYAGSSTTGTFTFGSTVTFNHSDVLEIDGPSPADITFSSPSWAFIGSRT